MEKLRIKTASTRMEEEDTEADDSTAIEKVTLAKALAKIDPSHLAASLKYSYPSSPEEIISKLVDYFGRALSKLSVEYKYPWPGTNQLPFLTDIPFARIPEPVYKTAADWIDKAHVYTLHKFIDWSFFWILDRLQGKPTDPHCELGVLAALSIILRSKPVVVDHILTLLSPPHHPLESLPEMIPFTVWMIAQVARVDLRLGLSSWAKFLLPLLRDTFQFNPRSRILMLQLVQNVVSHPKARDTLLSDAAMQGVATRLFPIPSFEMLLPLTFPASFDRVKDVTEWFQAVYPFLKEVALADAPRIGDMKQVTQSIFEFSLKFAEQGNAELAKEATEIAIWCLTKNVDCCKHWDRVYMENPKASVALLKKLVDEWKDHSLKLTSSRRETRILNETMDSFLLKNETAISGGETSASLYQEADIYRMEISERLLSRGNGRNSVPKGIVGTVQAAVVFAGGAVVGACTSSILSYIRKGDLDEYLNAVT